MSSNTRLRAYLYASVAPIMFGAIALASTDAGAGPLVCQGAGAPTNTQTRCLTAIQIPGNPLRSFDISWVDPNRAEYYFADRSNNGVDVIDTRTLKFKRTIAGFKGAVLNGAGTAVNNNVSGPDGVVSHGHWLYAGDGDSTLKVIDLNNLVTPIQASISTGGTTRVDEMSLTPDGKTLMVANNAEDPPYSTLFHANGDSPVNTMSLGSIFSKITIDPTILPPNFGLGFEQSLYDARTQRFYASLPTIANNPPGCNYGQLSPTNITCHGGMVVINPTTVGTTAVMGAYNPTTNTGVIPLNACGPNGITQGLHGDLLEGCNPGNAAGDVTQLVINDKSLNSANINGITGSDEVWFNAGDNRYYLGASKDCPTPGTACGNGGPFSAHLGVVSGTNILIEKIPQSANSHSVAADSFRNLIFVPQVAPTSVVGSGGDTTAVGAGICGTSNGCVAVYLHDVNDHDHDGDDHDH
ncbi:MAG TPA: hypothetical protein VLX44_07590 [Xanthobacteraceae bacterium]|nr:hypothetical protein [Xanthobacteraceae bacterium]